MNNAEVNPAGTESDNPGSVRRIPVNWLISAALILVIIASALWLPPLSLAKRVLERGYTSIGQETWSVTDPDGTQFTVPAEGMRGSLKARLTSVPRADLLGGKGDDDLIRAAQSVPSYLDIKSPLYRLSLRGDMPSSAILTIPIPNDAQPYETLDLYAWTQTGWSWLPSRVIDAEDLVLAELDQVPAQLDLVVAQTHLLPPIVSADLTVAEVPEQAAGAVVEINPQLLALGSNGQIGDVSQATVSPESFAVVPVLSNRDPGGTIRNDLADNVLADPALRQAHISAILDTVTKRGFNGIEIDYAAINPALRNQFTEFIAQLAEQLHQQGKILTVRVETPRQVSYDEWDTGVFDWRALGRSVDGLKVPVLSDPQAFVSEGPMDQLIRWAVSQVNRQQLQFMLSTRSTDLLGSSPTSVSYLDALKSFSQVTVEGGRQTFKAGEEIVFALSAGQGSTTLMYDEQVHTYWYRYMDGRGQEHTVWLQNADSIAHKLRALARYNLRGVAFQHLLEDANDEQIWQVVREYHSQTIPAVTNEFAVVWTVVDGSGKGIENLTTPLSDPRLVWVAPQSEGQYKVIASLSSDGGQTAAAQGDAVVEVGRETPVPTPTPEPTQTVEATPTPEPSPTPQATPAVAKAEPQAVVTNASLNLRAGPGTGYQQVGSVRKDDKLTILGRNPEGTWIKIAAPDGTEAWVILTYVTINVDLNDIPMAEVPAMPTPAPQPTSAPVSPPSGSVPTRSTGFGYGIQAHQDTARVVQAINDMGFGWLKQQVRWAQVEGSKGQYGWSGLDNLADTARAGGVKVLFSVVVAPGWSRPGKSGDGPPDNYQDFASFMGAMAAHFRGRVQAYEIWNEQNLKREWEGSPLSASDYVRLLRGAYQAIKAADPSAIVVSGALTPTGINDGNWAIDDRTYLQQMYNAGLRYYCDAVGAHPSGYANPPDVYYTGGDFDPKRGYDDHPSFFFQNTMVDYYRIMAANGDGAKRIWATEFGWPTVSGMGVGASQGYEFANDINEQQQADYIVRAYTWSRSWGHAGTMFLWNLNFWPASGAQDEKAKYGIVRGDWSPRPAYTALKNMAK